MTTVRSTGRWPSGVAALALAVVLVGGCGDDDAPGASDSTAAASSTAPAPTDPATTAPASTTSTSPPPPVTSAAGEVDPAVVAELQAAIDAYDAAYALATAAPGDPSHVDFMAATTDGDVRQGVQAAIADRRAVGEALRPGPVGVVIDQRIDSVTAVSATEATVVTCLFNGFEEYVVDTGEVLDGRQLSWPNEVGLRRGDDGTWRVDSSRRVGDYREVAENSCA